MSDPLEKDRVEFQKILETYLGNVYFQAPKNTTMNYPCIVFSRENIDGMYANNEFYSGSITYQISIIIKDYTEPGITIPYKLLTDLEYTSFTNEYISDGLRHTILTTIRRIN